MVGVVHAKQPLTLHRRIGAASNGTESFELLSGEPLGEPMVVHPDGRTFSLSWDDVIKMAREAFDKPQAEPGN